MKSINKRLFDYIAKGKTAYHAVENTANILLEKGFSELRESEEWKIFAGKSYFVKRNNSSIVAFKMPKSGVRGFMIAASHSDSPCFKIKDNAELSGGNYTRLSVERYGGMICSSWLDRPLGVAGRVITKTETGIKSTLFDIDKPCAIIPNVAIHQQRNINEGMNYNAAVDMIPLYRASDKKGAFLDAVAKAARVKKEDILSSDMFVYNIDKGIEWGEFISAPRLDDLQCAFASLDAFVDCAPKGSVPVYALFDNEEVGSQTKQGAASTFLCDVLERISASAGCMESHRSKIAASFMISCDNGHAVHPNHPEYADKNHSVYMNGGVVIKYNANQKYTSDGVSAAIFKLLCEKAGVKYQMYCNRADMAGGSTLGNISNTQISLNTVDVGFAQLAMHSAFETAGANDTEDMINVLKLFYSSEITLDGDSIELK